MSAAFRSHLTVALVVTILAAFVAIGLQAASAGDEDMSSRAVVDDDFYYRTKVWTCSEGGTHCSFDRLNTSCRQGDEAIGGIGWVTSPTDKIINLAAVDLADHPVGLRGWRVVAPEGIIGEGYTVRVRVYCADIG